MIVLPRRPRPRVQRERLICAHVTTLHAQDCADPAPYLRACAAVHAQERRTPWWARIGARNAAVIRYAREIHQSPHVPRYM